MTTCSSARSGYCVSFPPIVFLFPSWFSPLCCSRHIMTCLPKNNVSRCGCKLRLNPKHSVSASECAFRAGAFPMNARTTRLHIHWPQMTGLGLAFLIRSAECRKDVFLAPSSLISFVPRGGSFFLPCYPERIAVAFRLVKCTQQAWGVLSYKSYNTLHYIQ